MPSTRNQFLVGGFAHSQRDGPPKGSRGRAESPLVASAEAKVFVIRERKAFSCPLQGSCFLHKFLLVARGRRFPKGERKALWPPPQRRNLLRYGKGKKGSFPCLPQGMYFLWEVSSACGRTRYFPRAGKYPKGATGYVFAKGEYVGRKATWLSLSESQPWAAKGCMRRGRPRSPRC